MLVRTHFTISLIAALFFMPYVDQDIPFLAIVLIAGLLPDLDTAHSYLGKHLVFRPLQWFVRHRGFLHSLTLCSLVGLGFALVYPPFAFPFFLGYSFHLLADSFTVDGIRPFWPLKEEVQGRLHTGGRFEGTLFIVLCILAVFLFVSLFA